MNKAYLALGSNIGDKKKHLKSAIDIINSNENIKLNKISSLYKTAPIGYTEQDWFLNAVIEIDTNLKPLELLDVCQFVETELKRKRIIHWGPRTIDVDVLLFNEEEINHDRLLVPHPRMHERAFVMIPLSEINPNALVKGKTASYYKSILENQEIEIYDEL